MASASDENPYNTSKILFLPFINAPVSNYDTYFSVLPKYARLAAKIHVLLHSTSRSTGRLTHDIVSSADPNSAA